MACTLEQKQANLCTSGIGKVTDPIKLLQIAAQVWCEAVLSPPDPYDGPLVYTRSGLGTTTVVNPSGAYNLTFGSNFVTEIHCHNCPLITGMTINNSAVLAIVDFVNCPALAVWRTDNCDALTSIDLGFIGSATSINVNDCASLATIDLSGLVTSGATSLSNNPMLSSISLPLLQDSGSYLAFAGAGGITSFNLPSYGATFVSEYSSTGCTSLQTISINSAVLPQDCIFDSTACSLNQATVDIVLQAGIGGGITAGLIGLDGGTNSTPSASGLINKGILIGLGVEVFTN